MPRIPCSDPSTSISCLKAPAIRSCGGKGALSRTGKQGVAKSTSREPKHRNSGMCQSVHFERSQVLTVENIKERERERKKKAKRTW